ncbi:hypothetical protein BKA62DRAFT_792345 [Auriculariales sp. MPI-PUGE-AT-0066]|nr:hypothetical protein BKA62DRAFT_792345 [Auriculariales sp. MPI-PUGE-AT-0066]
MPDPTPPPSVGLKPAQVECATDDVHKFELSAQDRRQACDWLGFTMCLSSSQPQETAQPAVGPISNDAMDVNNQVFLKRIRVSSVEEIIHDFGIGFMKHFQEARTKANTSVEFHNMSALKSDLIRCFEEERKTIPAGCTQPETLRSVNIRGQYWMEYLADFAGPAGHTFQFQCNHEKNFTTVKTKKSRHSGLSDKGDSPLSSSQSGSQTSASSSQEADTDYTKKRKLDAYLRIRKTEVHLADTVLIPVELTTSQIAANVAKNPQTAFTNEKLRQVLMNASDLLNLQPSRFAVWYLCFSGTNLTKLHVGVLGRTILRLAVIEDAFSQNLSLTSALLHTLRTSPIHNLGFLPFFDYSYNIKAGHLLPLAVHLPPDEYSQEPSEDGSPIEEITYLIIQPEQPLSSQTGSTFGRGTYCLKAQKGTGDKVLKLAWVSEDRTEREAKANRALACATGRPTLLHSPAMSYAFAFHSIPLYGSALTTDPTTLRHAEFMVFDTPGDGKRLLNAKHQLTHSPSVTFRILRQLVLAVMEAGARRVVHRDISLGNVLVRYNGHEHELLFLDYECAEGPDLPTSERVAGTVDTMAIELLPDIFDFTTVAPNARPWLDLQVIVYLSLKLLTQSFVPTEQMAHPWKTALNYLLWDTTDGTLIRHVREQFWSKKAGPLINTFESMNATAHAELLRRLAAIPLSPTLPFEDDWTVTEWSNDQFDAAQKHLADPLSQALGYAEEVMDGQSHFFQVVDGVVLST